MVNNEACAYLWHVASQPCTLVAIDCAEAPLVTKPAKVPNPWWHDKRRKQFLQLLAVKLNLPPGARVLFTSGLKHFARIAHLVNEGRRSTNVVFCTTNNDLPESPVSGPACSLGERTYTSCCTAAVSNSCIAAGPPWLMWQSVLLSTPSSTCLCLVRHGSPQRPPHVQFSILLLQHGRLCCCMPRHSSHQVSMKAMLTRLSNEQMKTDHDHSPGACMTTCLPTLPGLPHFHLLTEDYIRKHVQVLSLQPNGVAVAHRPDRIFGRGVGTAWAGECWSVAAKVQEPAALVSERTGCSTQARRLNGHTSDLLVSTWRAPCMCCALACWST